MRKHRSIAAAATLVVAASVAAAVTLLPRPSSADPASDMAMAAAVADRQTLVVVERCDKTYTLGDGTAHRFAEHGFPFGAESWLARVAVVGHGAGVARAAPSGYEARVVDRGVFVRSGAIAVDCGVVGSADALDTVTLVLPRAYRLDEADPWTATAQTSAQAPAHP